MISLSVNFVFELSGYGRHTNMLMMIILYDNVNISILIRWDNNEPSALDTLIEISMVYALPVPTNRLVVSTLLVSISCNVQM